MKKTVTTLGCVTVLMLGILLVLPPFLLPDPVYAVLYGWRYPKRWSCGEARIVDYGPATAVDRFVVGLGQVPVGQEVHARFQLCDLPAEMLAIGFVVHLIDRQREASQYVPVWHYEQAAAEGTWASLRLSTRDDGVLLEHGGLLSADWTWSGPYGNTTFVYSLETLVEARSGENYDLELRLEPQLEAELEGTELVLRGGGWK